MLPKVEPLREVLQGIQEDQKTFQKLQGDFRDSIEQWEHEKSQLQQQINRYQETLKSTLEKHVQRIEKQQEDALKRVQRRERNAHDPEQQRVMIRLKQSVEQLRKDFHHLHEEQQRQDIASLQKDTHTTLPEKSFANQQSLMQHWKQWEFEQKERQAKLKKEVKKYLTSCQQEWQLQQRKQMIVSFAALGLSLFALLLVFFK